MGKWMINCKAYSELVSQQLDQALPFRERLLIKIHQWLCPPCRALRNQFETLRRVCRSAPDQDSTANQPALPDEACRQIKSILRNLPK